MSKSSKGILRSKPRYSTTSDVNPPVSVRAPNIVSHECHGDAPSNDVTPVTMNSRDVVERFQTGINQNSVSSPSSPSRDENHMARGSKKNTRSLADLVRCSVNLSNEARGIVNTDEGSEHQPKKESRCRPREKGGSIIVEPWAEGDGRECSNQDLKKQYRSCHSTRRRSSCGLYR
mmetsp:Transcript_2566/g.5278  ORF Transcript_2566/g.5278 Transcript_2566/m.5278 type:complete len:175 (-) Transcript_2566:2284-2808(-)